MGQERSESLSLQGDDREGSRHRVYRDAGGQLVIEWAEDRDPAPYDHATTISFDANQEFALRRALEVEDGDLSTISVIASRFQSYWAVRDFAKLHEVKFQQAVNFWP